MNKYGIKTRIISVVNIPYFLSLIFLILKLVLQDKIRFIFVTKLTPWQILGKKEI